MISKDLAFQQAPQHSTRLTFLPNLQASRTKIPHALKYTVHFIEAKYCEDTSLKV